MAITVVSIGFIDIFVEKSIVGCFMAVVPLWLTLVSVFLSTTLVPMTGSLTIYMISSSASFSCA